MSLATVKRGEILDEDILESCISGTGKWTRYCKYEKVLGRRIFRRPRGFGKPITWLTSIWRKGIARSVRGDFFVLS